jgi:ribonucleoside-diphosphate reductase beta chain
LVDAYFIGKYYYEKIKGLGQIISWSIQDENLHAEGMIEVFREYAKQNRKELWTKETKARIYQIAREMVDLEDKFLDLAFGMLKVEGLTKEEVKLYIRYIADGRLISLGLKPIYGIEENPLFWVETMLGASHTNFFEQQVTDYAKGTLLGSWADVWGQAK